MISVTTPSIEGKKIIHYHGIVCGEVVAGVNMFKDIAASFTNLLGGRSTSYEGELIEARQQALLEMEERARSLGANAIVGIDIDYEVLGQQNDMLMVIASGTAVTVDEA